ncbi:MULTISPECIES: hypothetical protein [Thiomicrorhabdus]|uniref:Uncharacterized protein n=1 Tax=Thiomicrorhabdus heinhorstiae TaxID=2748010 RepID=A0ABS0BTC5_9GAMM|nr:MULTISPECIES: hypothetical protein [Thiomicrorhabdus]MBF6057025.1 hypothetical protein [Thiomicrorhabdus heinhorstiae]
MASVTVLNPKTLPKQSKRPDFQKTQGSAGEGKADNKVATFRCKEVFMMPGDWAVAGNPTPYELRVTLHTCRRLWQMNLDALEDPRFNPERSQENIAVLERLHTRLMDLLVK